MIGAARSEAVDQGGASHHYRTIARAIEYLSENRHRQPSLRDAADAAGLSEFHFQRLFRQWAGISPKRFLQYLTAENAKELLRRSRPVLEAAYASGLSGPGRLHDLFVATEAMTPGEYKNGGRGLEIRWGVHATPFGHALFAFTERGVCGISFLPAGDAVPGAADLSAGLAAEWPHATLREDARAAAALVRTIFAPLERRREGPVRLLLEGTNFQVRVWEALLRIPPGVTVSYQEVARAVGNPRAQRAVGAAIARNRIALLIPCHRVVRQSGALGGYRWGEDRKRVLLAWERASENSPPA